MSEQPVIHPVAQPQDHRSADTFTFQSESGPVTVPKFKRIMSFGFVRKNREMDEQDLMFKALEEHCDEQTLEAVDRLNLAEIQPFFEQWQKDSGVGLGESSRS